MKKRYYLEWAKDIILNEENISSRVGKIYHLEWGKDIILSGEKIISRVWKRYYLERGKDIVLSEGKLVCRKDIVKLCTWYGEQSGRLSLLQT